MNSSKPAKGDVVRSIVGALCTTIVLALLYVSPLVFDHINLLGRYAFSVPDSVGRGELRPLRNPGDAIEDVA